MRLQPFAYALVFLLILFAANQAGVISPSHPNNSPAQAAETSEQIFTNAKAAVMRVGVAFTGTVEIPGFTIDPQTFAIKAGGKSSEESVIAGFSGSGFVVNSNGYIVTNAHVVDTSDDTATTALWNEVNYDIGLTLDQQLPKSFSQAAFDTIHKNMFDFIYKNGKLKDVNHKIAVLNPDQKDGKDFFDFIDKGFPAQVTKIGAPYPEPGHDLAVIKIDKQNMPTLRLSTKPDPTPGNKVLVIGFPGAADLQNSSSWTEPTLTSGIVSANKPSDAGPYNLIQIDANINHGNSGGPALDEHGDVIGIATLGSAEGAAGFNFILPVSLARTDLKDVSVSYTGSKTGITALIDGVSPALLIGGSVGVVIILGLIITLAIVLRRRKPTPQNVPSAPLPPATAQVAAPLPPATATPVATTPVVATPQPMTGVPPTPQPSPTTPMSVTQMPRIGGSTPNQSV